MNKIFALIFSTLLLVCVVLHFSSCNKGGNPYPIIAFDKDTIYISKDTSLYRGTIFRVGISAAKTGAEGILKSFKISRRINNAADSTLLIDATLNTQYFKKLYGFTTGDSGNTERYTFTVGNQLGYTNSVEFTNKVR